MLPTLLQKKLETQYGKELTNKIINGYKTNRVTSFRINTLKTTKEEVFKILEKNNFILEEISWYPNAYIVLNKNEEDIKKLDIYNNGFIYLQSLSSMIPVLVLNPENNDHILDMAAAPGSKTTQIAMQTNNKARITACERNKIRAERLKYNLIKQGVTCTTVLVTDARDLDDLFSFDKILLDAPCSGSGTITLNSSFDMFTNERIDKITKTQLNLLRKALKILKKGQTMVYSTCSILEEENEAIIQTIMKEYNIELLPIMINIDEANILPTKIDNTLCICPNKYFEGFFVASIKKISD